MGVLSRRSFRRGRGAADKFDCAWPELPLSLLHEQHKFLHCDASIRIQSNTNNFSSGGEMDNKAREKFVAENPTSMPIEDYLALDPFDGQITYGEMGVCALIVALAIYAVMKGK